MIINFTGVKREVAEILYDALEGREISAEAGTVLLSTQGRDLDAVTKVAHAIRQKTCGNETSFIITRNINFTNVCYMGCSFCGFARSKDHATAELLPMDEVARRAKEAWQRGATEVCIQGGLHPDISGEHYRNIVLAVKKAVPEIHVHAFSPFEILFGSRKSKLSFTDFLTDLKECGLGSMPGTAAEILDTEVRKVLTKNKLSAEAWVEIIRAAHKVGLKTTSTMMYGHVDEPKHWADHIALLREIQKETGGFTEFVPLGFVHFDSPLYLQKTGNKSKPVRPGPTEEESIAIHAVARIMLNGYIDNIQVSWVKLGPKFAQKAQQFGVNDLGGTLMNESISRAAGARYGQEVTPSEMCQLIENAGFTAVQRSTLYKPLMRFEKGASTFSMPTLVPRSEWQASQITEII